LTQSSGPSLQGIINACWALFDIGIVYTYFRFGKRYWPQAFSNNPFVGWSILVFVTSFVLQLLFFYEFGADLGARYSVFDLIYIDLLPWVRRRPNALIESM